MPVTLLLKLGFEGRSLTESWLASREAEPFDPPDLPSAARRPGPDERRTCNRLTGNGRVGRREVALGEASFSRMCIMRAGR